MVGEEDEVRPDWSNDPKKFVWQMLKRQRDQARKTMEASDLLMQALEAAPEIESAMQVAFNLTQPASQTARAPQPGQPGFQVKP